MPDGRGGYRAPANPAPVSGPGALSQRTDGRQAVRDLPNAKYGENAAFRAAEGAAPMSESGPVAAPAGGVPLDLSRIVPMDAPTQMPDQPITAGLPTGDGPGSTAAPQRPQITPEQAQRLRSYIPTLTILASSDDASPATRQFVRQLRAELG